MAPRAKICWSVSHRRRCRLRRRWGSGRAFRLDESSRGSSAWPKFPGSDSRTPRWSPVCWSWPWSGPRCYPPTRSPAWLIKLKSLSRYFVCCCLVVCVCMLVHGVMMVCMFSLFSYGCPNYKKIFSRMSKLLYDVLYVFLMFLCFHFWLY